MTPDIHEETLISRIRQGNGNALAELFQSHRARLRQMLQLRIDARVAGRIDESDMLQEAFLDAVRQIGAYMDQPRVTFYIWLRGLVYERLLNLQRTHLGAERRTVKRERPLPEGSSVSLG